MIMKYVLLCAVAILIGWPIAKEAAISTLADRMMKAHPMQDAVLAGTARANMRRYGEQSIDNFSIADQVRIVVEVLVLGEGGY
jgi:UDP-N-acetylmuramoylalanine-D-glutamate ligase